MGSYTKNAKLCGFTNNNNDDFMSTPIAPPATQAESFEIGPALLNLVMKEQLAGTFNEDVASHLHKFVEVCDMQKYKEVEADYVNLNFSVFIKSKSYRIVFYLCLKIILIHGTSAKMLLLEKYYPPAKIILLGNLIMNFKQLDHEHVAQAWERMKICIEIIPLME